MDDLISRQVTIDSLNQAKKIMLSMIDFLPKDEEVKMRTEIICGVVDSIKPFLDKVPSAQPEIIRCKDCEYGEQDDIGRWFCNDLGCQIGSEDGSGYCANAERRTDG